MEIISCQQCSIHVFIDSLMRALESRDPYTAGHSDRVAQLAGRISREMGFSNEKSQLIHLLGHVHDIGKIGIPDGILLKTGPLTVPEYSVIQEHSVIGYNILKDIPYFKGHAENVLYHHERLDGSGYPEGLIGSNIPFESSIIAVADVFDAITSARTYRKALDINDAFEIIEQEKGHKLDNIVVDTLFSIDRSFLISLVEKSSQFQPVYMK